MKVLRPTSAKPSSADGHHRPDGIEHVIHGREQRFADVKARKPVAFEQHDGRPARVSHAAAVDPAGPPPMTTTSQSNDIRMRQPSTTPAGAASNGGCTRMGTGEADNA